MNYIEKMIYDFIGNFYTYEEKKYIKENNEIAYTVNDFKQEFTSNSWKNIEAMYKNLLNYADMSNFHLEVADNASYFIKKIFKHYVDYEKTFVIHSSFEHPNVIKELNHVKHKKSLFYDNIITFNFDDFLPEYKKSKCNKIFVYVPGTSTCTGQIVPQNFYLKIKVACQKYNIECIMCCDDVHGMFITPRDYSIFDFVLYTCHSYIPDFNMGMLWTKKPEFLGFTNTERSNIYYNKLKMFLSKTGKMRLFSLLLTEFFAETLADPIHFDLYTNTTPHIFAIKTKGLVFNQTYFDQCDRYNVRLGETLSYINFMRYRIQEFVLEDPQFLIEGLRIGKKALNSFKNKVEKISNNIEFNGIVNIKHEIKENILIKNE